VVEPAEDVQKRGLARARGPEQNGKLAREKLQVHAGQRMHLDLAGVIGLAQVFGAEHQLNHFVHLRLTVSQIRRTTGLIWRNNTLVGGGRRFPRENGTENARFPRP
jgi:hypothetical protein